MNFQIKQRPVFIEQVGLILRVIVSLLMITFFFSMNRDVNGIYFFEISISAVLFIVLSIIWRYRYSLHSIVHEDGYWYIDYFRFNMLKKIRLSDSSDMLEVSYNKWLINKKSTIPVSLAWCNKDGSGMVKIYLSSKDVSALDAALATQEPSPFKPTNDVE